MPYMGAHYKRCGYGYAEIKVAAWWVYGAEYLVVEKKGLNLEGDDNSCHCQGESNAYGSKRVKNDVLL